MHEKAREEAGDEYGAPPNLEESLREWRMVNQKAPEEDFDRNEIIISSDPKDIVD